MWLGNPDITNKMEKDVKPNQTNKQTPDIFYEFKLMIVGPTETKL